MSRRLSVEKHSDIGYIISQSLSIELHQPARDKAFYGQILVRQHCEAALALRKIQTKSQCLFLYPLACPPLPLSHCLGCCWPCLFRRDRRDKTTRTTTLDYRYGHASYCCCWAILLLMLLLLACTAGAPRVQDPSRVIQTIVSRPIGRDGPARRHGEFCDYQTRQWCHWTGKW